MLLFILILLDFHAIVYVLVALFIIPIVIAMNIISYRIKCPNCGTSIGCYENNILCGGVRSVTSLFNKECQICGFDLDKCEDGQIN